MIAIASIRIIRRWWLRTLLSGQSLYLSGK